MGLTVNDDRFTKLFSEVLKGNKQIIGANIRKGSEYILKIGKDDDDSKAERIRVSRKMFDRLDAAVANLGY